MFSSLGQCSLDLSSWTIAVFYFIDFKNLHLVFVPLLFTLSAFHLMLLLKYIIITILQVLITMSYPFY